MSTPDGAAAYGFGFLLRQHRLDAGLTQEALAESAGISARAIQTLERGHHRPQDDTVARLARSLDLRGEALHRFRLAARPMPRRLARWRDQGALATADSTSARVAEALAQVPPPYLDIPSSNLPVALTSFVGRERELADVARLLGSTRLLTLTGTGGCGKTRLALETAGSLVEDYRDGVWLADLSPLSRPELVPQTMAGALGVVGQAGVPVAETLVSALRPKRLLVVLDNCEHLLDAAASIAETLLRSCPGVKVLATSREALGMAGETCFRVPSLSLPESKDKSPEDLLRRLATSEAAMLFLERAKAARPDFALTERNAPFVELVCRRLDGMPLALELAAARVRGLSVEQIARRLDDRFHLLVGGSRTALPRQQTLLAAIQWSHDLLSADERVLIRRLAVFAGSFSLEAAESVGADTNPGPYAGARRDVLDLLLRLVDRSLVVADETLGEARYRLLETIRQYAQDRLRESGEEEAIRDRHRDHYLGIARLSEEMLEGSESGLWLARLEMEHGNLRAALAWCLTRDVRLGLELAGNLTQFWDQRCHYQEGSRWAAVLLAASSEESIARAKVLRIAGMFARGEGHFTEARRLLEESLEICRRLGNQREYGRTAQWLGDCFTDAPERELLLTEALEIARATGDRYQITTTLESLSWVARLGNDRERARHLLEDGLAVARSIGHRMRIAWMTLDLGTLALDDEDCTRARPRVEESLALFQHEGNDLGAAGALAVLGYLAVTDCDYRRALSLAREALRAVRRTGSTWYVADILLLVGRIAVESFRYEQGVRLFAAVDSLGERARFTFEFLWRSRDASLATARGAIGGSDFARAWEEGQAITLDDAVESALSEEWER